MLAQYFNKALYYHKKMKRIMKRITLSGMLFAAMLTFSACSNNKTEDSKEVAEEQNEAKLDDTKLEDDSEFAIEAADGGMMEVQLGELAKTNAASADVKKFGATMVEEHGKANDELKALATQKNITLPMSLSDEKQKKMDELSKKKGAEFDKDYISFMVDDHKDDISKFEEAASDAKDAEVKAWAAGKVPALKHHLEMAQTLNEKMK
jgi:putative membrane protein